MALLINIIEAIFFAGFISGVLNIANKRWQCFFTLVIGEFILVTLSNYFTKYDLFLTTGVILLD